MNKQSKQADKFQLYNIPQHWIDSELRKKNLLIQLNSGQKKSPCVKSNARPESDNLHYRIRIAFEALDKKNK